MAKLLLILALLTLTQIEKVSSEKILVVAFSGSKSHKNAFEPLYIELARKGHQLTIIHPVKSGYTDKNMKEINGINFEDILEKEMAAGDPNGEPPINIFDLRLKGLKIRTPINPVIIPYLQKACESYYEMEEVKAVMKQKFALVFVSSHMNECTYGFVHKLNTSYIFVQPHAIEHYKSSFTGFRPPASFVPSYAAGAVTDDMTFLDRIFNFLAYQGTMALYDWYYLPHMETTYRKYVGEATPSAREIEANASLILNNAHFTLTYPRPQMPQVIDVAGMHCQPGKPLPKDLQDFVESSGNDGFIYFSMGSHVKGSTMPKHILQSFVTAFSKIKQKVLWKFDLDKIEGLSSNVKLVRWAPQQDLLAHSKIRVFMSHGGLLSTEESAYHGVPIIGHDMNMHQAVSNGYGIALELNTINTEQILTAINTVLADKRFASAAKATGQLFRDRQTSAVDTALYWTEYVLRHKGAVHLRSPASKLNFFAYYSLDVIAFLSLILALLVYIPIKLCKMCCCGGSSSKKETPSKKRPNTRSGKKDN
ncbi:UDP-glucuronosyltransferase 2C1 [Folsomia candida]|uniref:UDP-glucuronosyltransferase 2C1 n=1 Tax=Folsomia candida TaxID=158441 RepID=A0A226EEB2_FOLCA|nr:UDP-glucuronosyltransferase 2C1 [Folsomia candida]